MPLRAETRRFSDVFLHSQAIANWSQRYDQISPGSASTTLRQISGQRFHVFHEQLNQRVLQQGRAPHNHLCFALPVVRAVAPIVQGRAVNFPSRLTLRSGEEFVVHLPGDTDVIAFTIDRALTVESEHAALSELPERTLTQPVLPVSPLRYEAAVDDLQDVLRAALGSESLVNRGAFNEKVLTDSVVGIVLGLVQTGDEGTPTLPHMSTQSYIVRKSQEVALDSNDDLLTVLDLCRHLKISRRTLQYSFQNIAGTTPTAYLRSIRLNAVRRFLMTSPPTFRIGDVAAQFGFCHFGRFSSYYHQHFHELPSQTLRA